LVVLYGPVERGELAGSEDSDQTRGG